MAELSDKARKLFEDPNILFVATVNSDGSPQVTPVWTHVEDGPGHVQHREGPGQGAQHAP